MNKSNKHENYRRPEITRTNDLLAKDQRTTIELQRKKLEFVENTNRSDLIGLVNSKIYSNVEMNADFCRNYCEEEIINPKQLLNSPVNNNKVFKQQNQNCLNLCVEKRGESFRMLMNVKFNL